MRSRLSAAKNLYLLSAEEGNEPKEKSKAPSGEVGVTIGSEAGIGVYVSASASKGKGQGDGSTHAETIIRGSDTTRFASGGDTIGKGAQIIGDTVIGRVGGDMLLQSQQDTNDYQRKDQSAGVDAAVGIGGGSVSANYSQSKLDSDYTSVEKQTGIQAGKGGVDLYVEGHLQLDGAAIASTADPSKNRVDVGSLGWSDLRNEAEYKATSVSVSGGGGSSGGSFSGGYANTSDSSSSTTKAGIADGTLVVRDGSGGDIARGVTELQQDGLEPILDAQKVAETLETQQVAGEVGFTAVGDFATMQQRKAADDLVAAQDSGDKAAEADAKARLDSWSDGGTNKTLLHGMTGAAAAALGGGDIIGGALGAAGAEKAKGAMSDYLIANGIERGSTAYETLMGLGSTALGGALGGETGASTALAGDVYNRQLHPEEMKLILGELAPQYAKEMGISEQKAENLLLKQALRQVDDQWAEELGPDDGKAKQWLASNTPEWAKSNGYFTATPEQRADSTMYGEYYDKAYHAKSETLGDQFGDLLNSFLGGDDYTAAEHGSRVDMAGYKYAANELRDQATLEALLRKPGAEWTNEDVQTYANLATLYPMARSGLVVGPLGQAIVGVRDGDPNAVALAVVGAVPLEGAGAGVLRAADDVSGAAKAMNGVKLNRQLAAQEIAGGHAFEKHVLDQGEFAGLEIRTREQFASHIENVISNPSSVRYYKDGRTVYLQESTGTVVIRNPNGAEGTAFRPSNWNDYVSKLPARTRPFD